MNPDLMCNLYSQAQYYQPYIYFPQQQFFQYMMFQKQTPTVPIPSQKYDTPIFLNNGITQQSIESPNMTKTLQNNHLTEVDFEHQEKCSSIQDESQSRVNGHWTKQEHLLYLEFVKNHESILRSKYDKKSKKIFKLMSQYIPTRTATQCRSHHQKFNPLTKSKKKCRQTNKIPTVIHP
ncbi:unnamed protein product [Paramecium pentaurelia]|uniref:Myb-like domain-containing protein n=1 Tax=Paramecium pentaurelia TaxID=43138 RepID=A0A8S1X425_9CILI|nr:unnamed protein product [Paramecium pentaurelia]